MHVLTLLVQTKEKLNGLKFRFNFTLGVGSSNMMGYLLKVIILKYLAISMQRTRYLVYKLILTVWIYLACKKTSGKEVSCHLLTVEITITDFQTINNLRYLAVS
jgi:hypothetical protein